MSSSNVVSSSSATILNESTKSVSGGMTNNHTIKAPNTPKSYDAFSHLSPLRRDENWESPVKSTNTLTKDSGWLSSDESVPSDEEEYDIRSTPETRQGRYGGGESVSSAVTPPPPLALSKRKYHKGEEEDENSRSSESSTPSKRIKISTTNPSHPYAHTVKRLFQQPYTVDVQEVDPSSSSSSAATTTTTSSIASTDESQRQQWLLEQQRVKKEMKENSPTLEWCRLHNEIRSLKTSIKQKEEQMRLMAREVHAFIQNFDRTRISEKVRDPREGGSGRPFGQYELDLSMLPEEELQQIGGQGSLRIQKLLKPVRYGNSIQNLEFFLTRKISKLIQEIQSGSCDIQHFNARDWSHQFFEDSRKSSGQLLVTRLNRVYKYKSSPMTLRSGGDSNNDTNFVTFGSTDHKTPWAPPPPPPTKRRVIRRGNHFFYPRPRSSPIFSSSSQSTIQPRGSLVDVQVHINDNKSTTTTTTSSTTSTFPIPMVTPSQPPLPSPPLPSPPSTLSFAGSVLHHSPVVTHQLPFATTTITTTKSPITSSTTITTTNVPSSPPIIDVLGEMGGSSKQYSTTK